MKFCSPSFSVEYSLDFHQRQNQADSLAVVDKLLLNSSQPTKWYFKISKEGSLRLTWVCSNGGVWCIRNFLSSFHIWCRGQVAVSKTRHCFKPNRCAQCRGTEWATRIGTFACHTFHRDTKASKRANLPSRDNELK